MLKKRKNNPYSAAASGLNVRISRVPLLSLLIPFLILFFASCEHSSTPSDTPRYIITSPEVGEIVYLLQGIEKIVGVTEEVNHPAPFQEIEKVGNFGKVSIEKVISLHPTLVITSGLEQELLSQELNKLGIETLVVYPQSIEQMLDSVEMIAEVMGITERGRIVRDSLEAEIEMNRYRGDVRSRPKVYIEIYGNPIMSVSSRSFIGELVTLAGGDNIFKELPREYSRVRQEEVIKADPQIIIVTYPHVSSKNIRSRKGWSDIAACQEERIYTIDDLNPDLILRAGPRLIEGLKAMKRLFFEEV